MTGSDDPLRSGGSDTRRRWLLTVGTALTAALAGCPSSGEEADGSATTETVTTTKATAETPMATPTTTEHSSTTATPTTTEHSSTTATPTTTEHSSTTATPTATEHSMTTTGSQRSVAAAKRVVREFYTAADDGEFERANALVHPESSEGTIGTNQQAFFERQNIDVREMEVLTSADDRTTLRVTLLLSRDDRERTEVLEIELRIQEGAWRLYRTG